MTIVVAPPETLALLELARVADTLLFVTCADQLPSPSVELSLACLRAQGVPTLSHAVVGLTELTQQKRRNEAKRVAAKLALDSFPETKVHFLEKPADATTALWTVLSQKRRHVHFRELRSHLLAETAAARDGCLHVTGYVRGPALDVNALVHVPGVGARRVRSVTVLPRPGSSFDKRAAGHDEGDVEMASLGEVVLPNPELQHSLETEVPIDPLAGEQTWPTAEEEEAADVRRRAQAVRACKLKRLRALKRFNKGLFEAQTSDHRNILVVALNLKMCAW